MGSVLIDQRVAKAAMDRALGRAEASRAEATMWAAALGKRPIESIGGGVEKAGTPRKKKPAAKTDVPTTKRRGKKCASKYWGVYWFAQKGKWRAQYQNEDGKQVFIGYFDNEEAAARAYNAKIVELKLKRPTNPEVDGKLVAKPDLTSKYVGVHWNSQTSSWKAIVRRSKRLGLDGKMKFLGYYDNEKSAALAVDTYIRLAMPSVAAAKVNFPTIAELTKLKLKTPFKVVLTRDYNGRRVLLNARLTKVKYDPNAVKNRAVWQYRVSFKHHGAAARAVGLKKRLWDTLVGDDSEFVAWALD